MKSWAKVLLVVLVLAAIAWIFRDRIHFDWGTFWLQLRHVRLINLLTAIALTYVTYLLRAWRWSVFLSPTKKVRASTLVGSQFIGFTAVALFGRLADLTRPYLIAKRVKLPVSSQIAVYTIERMFDLGAVAIIFSSAMAFTPRGLPHREIFVRVGLGSMILTLVIAMTAVAILWWGARISRVVERILARYSPHLAETITTKILSFRDGLNSISSLTEFFVASLISLAMWGLAGGAYLATAHAFVQTPELAKLTFARTMLLMAASIGGGLLTLPIIGWFTQIAATAAAMEGFYGAPLEAATACGALLLVVTLLSIIPVGFIFAQLDQVSLRQVTDDSSVKTDGKSG